MTNEEKACRIAERYCVHDYKDIMGDKVSSYDECFCSAMEMAEFKDEKLKNLFMLVCPYLDKDILYKAKEIAFNEKNNK